MPRQVSESDEDKNGNKAQENALPLHHGPPGVTVHPRAEVAGERHLHCDHVLPIADRGDLRPDLGNVQTLCSLCHARKTMAERRAPIAGGTGSRSEKLPIGRGDQRWPFA